MNLRKILALLLTLLLTLSQCPAALAYAVGSWPSGYDAAGCPSPDAASRNGGRHAYYCGEYQEATCTSSGYAVFTCVYCGDTQRKTYAALGHDWSSWVTDMEATCTEPGAQSRYCQRCGAGEDREYGPLGHNWSDWWEEYPGTCVKKGMIGRRCYRCRIEEYRYTEYGDHDWGEWRTVQEPTAFESGREERVCRIDPSHIETRAIPPIGAPLQPDGEVSIDLNASYAARSYGLGESFPVTLTVTNTGSVTLIYKAHGTYCPAGEGDPLAGLPQTLAPGESWSTVHTVTITDYDFQEEHQQWPNVFGRVWDVTYVYATDTGEQEAWDEYVLHEDLIVQDVSAFLTVTPDSGAGKKAGDYVYTTWTVTNNGTKPWKFVQSGYWYEDPLAVDWTNSYGLINQVFQPGESVTYRVGFPLADKQINAGALIIPYVLVIVSPVDSSEQVHSNTCALNIPLTDGDIQATLSVVPGSGAGKQAGDYVPTTWTVTNTGKAAWVFKQGAKAHYSDLTVDWTQEAAAAGTVCQPGESVVFEAGFLVTENWLESGAIGPVTLIAVVTPVGSDETVDSNPFEVTIPLAEQDLGVWLSYTVVNMPEGALQMGDKIGLNLWIHNDSSVPVIPTAWDVAEHPIGDLAEMGDDVKAPLGPGEVIGDYYEIVVDGNDWTAGQVVRTISGQYGYADEQGNVLIGVTNAVQPVFPLDESQVAATLSGGSGDGSGKQADDWVYVALDLTNTGNRTWHWDSYSISGPADAQYDFKDVYPHTELLELTDPGNSVPFTLGIQVTAEDANNGEIARTMMCLVRADWDDSRSEKAWSNQLEIHIPLNDADPVPVSSRRQPVLHLDGVYLGAEPLTLDAYGYTDEVTYVLTAANVGDAACDVSAIRVTLPDGFWNENEGSNWLYPGESVTFYVKNQFYETQADTDGKVQISFTAQGVYANGTVESNAVSFTHSLEAPIPGNWTPPDETDPSDAEVIKVTVSDPVDPAGYQEGEIVTYHITVTNLGDVAISPSVWDEMFGPQDLDSFPNLAPGDSGYAAFNYVVTAQDVANGYVYNIAYAVWEDPATGNYITAWSNPVTEPTTDRPSSEIYGVDVNITFLNPPANGSYYVLGEQFPIRVYWENTGIETLYNAEVYDDLAAWIHAAPGGLLYTGTLAPGEHGEFVYTYEVDEIDVEYGCVYDDAAIFGNDAFGNEYFNFDHESAPAGAPWPEVIPPPTGRIDPPAEGKAVSCVTALTGHGSGVNRFVLTPCAEHGEALSRADALIAAAGSDRTAQLSAWQQAKAIWQEELEEMYGRLLLAADDGAKAAVQAEKAQFSQFISAQESLLNAYYPNQPIMAAQLITEMLMRQVSDLCYTLGNAPALRPDSLLAAHESIGSVGSKQGCGFTATRNDKGEVVFILSLDDEHAQADSGMDAMLEKARTRAQIQDVFTRARLAYQSSLDGVINPLYRAADQETRKIIAGARQSFDAMMQGRQALLNCLYPDNPEIVAEVLAQTTEQYAAVICEKFSTAQLPAAAVPAPAATAEPTQAPTPVPTEAPTSVPTAAPTPVPTAAPTPTPVPNGTLKVKIAAVEEGSFVFNLALTAAGATPMYTKAATGNIPFFSRPAGEYMLEVIPLDDAVIATANGESVAVDENGVYTAPVTVFSGESQMITLTVTVPEKAEPEATEAPAENNAGLAGVWYLSEAQMGETRLNAAALGLSMSIQLREDGTAQVTMDQGDGPEEQAGTWTPTDGGAAVTVDGDTLECFLEDGNLTADLGGATGIFSREAPAAAEAPQTVSADSETAFLGSWRLSSVMAEGMMVPAAALGAVSDLFVIEAGKATETSGEGEDVSVTEYAAEFADGALILRAPNPLYPLYGEENITRTMQLCDNGQITYAQEMFAFYLDRVEE